MIAQVTADGCAWSQDKQNSPGMSSANRTQAKVGAYSSICEEEPHILLKIPFNYCWGLIMLLTTWLRWVWWYKEMELYPSMHFSCVLLNDRCIKTHSTESALALNARNVIVKLNSCGSSKVFRPSRHHGCERKQYAGGGWAKIGFHLQICRIIDALIFVYSRQKVANNCIWWAREIMNFPSQTDIIPWI